MDNVSTKDLYRAAAMAEGYESVPVDIVTFINDPRYMGAIYGGTIYPYWIERLKQVYPNPLYSPYQEVLITGAIGIGKSSISILGILYDLYRVTLLKDPHKKFKLIPTTPIVITLITATMDLASAVIADQLIDAIGESP
ncbi:hypothetical protein, partial [Candidatus Ruminimicrobium bovinum]|uniref:hypothetical protein n=1 Tax=Candidatus Ruminimicrobium bovinum TaxID=3242779 RepID=UPI0039B8A717